jgi:hypothetical protein
VAAGVLARLLAQTFQPVRPALAEQLRAFSSPARSVARPGVIELAGRRALPPPVCPTRPGIEQSAWPRLLSAAARGRAALTGFGGQRAGRPVGR